MKWKMKVQVVLVKKINWIKEGNPQLYQPLNKIWNKEFHLHPLGMTEDLCKLHRHHQQCQHLLPLAEETISLFLIYYYDCMACTEQNTSLQSIKKKKNRIVLIYLCQWHIKRFVIIKERNVLEMISKVNNKVKKIKSKWMFCSNYKLLDGNQWI